MSDITSDPTEPESSRYWKATSGFSYQEMIRTREGGGSRSYIQQERFLTQLVQTEQARLGRPLEVLEFGCGFGRHASYLAPLENVRYHGYDFSDSMLEPLHNNPPEALGDAAERLFSGPDALGSLGGRRFDLVFTVSVLIHNPTERLPGLLETLGQLTRPEGLVCLVENQLVPFGVWENSWHDGCWLHSYPDAVPEGWDLHYGSRFVETHDVYLLKRNEQRTRRYFLLQGPEAPRAEAQPVTLEALRQQALPKLQRWAEGVAHALRNAAANGGTREAELSERLKVETDRFTRRQRLQNLADDVVRLRAEHEKAQQAPPLPARGQPHALPPAAAVLVDAPFDTTWAHPEPRLGRITHVFHQDWHGIRAACGYAPGHKVALTAQRPLTPRELQQAVEACNANLTRTIVFQGFSRNAEELMLLLRKVRGETLRLVAVWHGSTSQFHFQHEREGLTRLLELKRKGVLDAVGCVKPEMHLLSADLYPGTLLNFAPRLPAGQLQRPAAPTRTAFIPTPNNWWKNFDSNLYAVAGAQGVDTVLTTAKFTPSRHLPVRARVVSLGNLRRPELLRAMAGVDLLLNVTLTECQPMTALEGMACGVACLTGPLSLGTLDGHPYQKMVQVPGTVSLGEIRKAAERVLALRAQDPAGLEQMISDYLRTLHAEAIHRYLEFTQL